MTTALNCLIASTSDSATHIPSLNLSNSKYQTTFIIQPAQTKQSTLLAKRYKPAELGDLLMKKIKTQTVASDAGSQDESPALKGFEDPLYESSSSKGLEGIESTSMIDEIESPSIKSTCDDNEKHEGHKSFTNLLMAQRSVSTPLVAGSFSLKPFKLNVNNGQKQIHHALEVLQKKMMIHQQSNILKEILLNAHRAQEPLNIPPLMAPCDSTVSTVKKGRITLKTGDEEQEVIYGDVEYPFLSQSIPFDEVHTLKGISSSSLALKNVMASSKSQDSISSGSSSPVYESVKQSERCLMDLEDSLTATRAETQKSESELGGEKAEGKRRRNNNAKKASPVKASAVTEKGKKVQRKEKNQEKTKAKREKSPLLSPVRSKRVTERKKNKWQMENQVESSLNTGRQGSEKKVPKVKWSSASQDEEKQIFFEGLRNLLNNNVTIKKNVDDMQTVLEATESQ